MADTRRRACAGLTLVELLVALGIFAFGATAVLGLLAAGAAMVRDASARTEAALIAEDALAEVRARLTASFEVGAFRRVAGEDGASGYVLWSDRRHEGVGGWRSQLVLTPIDATDPEQAELFHVELRLTARRRGEERARVWHAALCRRVRAVDLGAGTARGAQQ